MRIEFQSTWTGQIYYELGDVREQIRYSYGKTQWAFDGLTYETSPSNRPKIWEDGEEIASCPKKSWSRKRPSEWNVVDADGQPCRIIETYRKRGKIVDWRSDDGKRIMTYAQTGCCRATAVIRSDWSNDVGLLIGLVLGTMVPWILRD